MLNYTHLIRAVASCPSSVCCLGLQFQGKTSCNRGKLWLDTTPGTAFHVMSLCVKAPTKRPSVSFCCWHSFGWMSPYWDYEPEPVKSNRCFQLYNRLWKLPLVFFFTLCKPINVTQIDVQVFKVYGTLRGRERDRQQDNQSAWSDKTDSGELELMCFFDEGRTPRIWILNIATTLVISLLSLPSQYRSLLVCPHPCISSSFFLSIPDVFFYIPHR